MARTTLIDLHVTACVVGTPAKLVNRRDSAVDGVSAKDGKARRVKGVVGRCANTGYFLGLLEGEQVLTANGLIINALTEFLPVDIPVPTGTQLTFYFVSESGTALASLTAEIEEPE